MKKQRQMVFEWPDGHGGKRKGAGRKRKGDKDRVSHRIRSSFCKTRVVHVTCRIAAGLSSLRDPLTVALLLNYLARVCEKKGWRLVEYSIQTNHLHLVCEAEDQEALSRAMNGLMSGLARVLNKHWGRKGKVFEDRYHAESIDNPTQCRNALLYVLGNAQKHGSRALRSAADPCSTAPWFEFTSSPSQRKDQKPAASPKTWLLKGGWRRGGKIYITDHPHIPRKKPNPNPILPPFRPERSEPRDQRCRLS